MKPQESIKMKMTKQRKVILEELRSVTTHPTADEIYGMVRRKLPRISLGTVYRNLEKLSDEGVILKLEHAGKQRRYDGDTSEHHHIRCVRCGKVDDLMISPEVALGKDIENINGYELIDYKVEFSGVCPGCRGG